MQKVQKIFYRIDTLPTQKSLRSQKGATLVEFSIIALVLFTLLFAIIEFGMYLFNQQVITNASREGARHGIISRVPRVTKAEIEQKVNDYCQDHLVTFGSANNPVINVPDHNPNAKFGEPLKVTVSYNYGALFLPFMTKTMVAETIMRYE